MNDYKHKIFFDEEEIDKFLLKKLKIELETTKKVLINLYIKKIDDEIKIVITIKYINKNYTVTKEYILKSNVDLEDIEINLSEILDKYKRKYEEYVSNILSNIFKDYFEIFWAENHKEYYSDRITLVEYEDYVLEDDVEEFLKEIEHELEFLEELQKIVENKNTK